MRKSDQFDLEKILILQSALFMYPITLLPFEKNVTTD